MSYKLLICIHYIELGGAERALLGLLESFVQTKHQVDLFIYSHQGELMPYIPTEINLIPEHLAYESMEIALKNELFWKQSKVAAA